MTVSYPWEHERYCDAVRGEIERFATVARDADLAAPVPTCPVWTLAELIRHTGVIHRWAMAMVRDRAQQRYHRDQLDLGIPEDPRDYPGWLAAGAEPLAETLRVADPDTVMWAWGADQRARFWSRRMLHETTVHRVDAELTVGTEPQVEPEVAADGIDEFLVNLPHAAYFAPDVERLRDDGAVLTFQATDRPAGWRITLGLAGFDWQGDGAAGPPGYDEDSGDVTVRGSSADLYLLFWGRRGREESRYTVSGDSDLLAFWSENSAI